VAIMSNKCCIKIHDPFERIDFTKFVEGERSSGTFEFYSISRVIKASVFFCGYIVAAYTVKNELIGFTYVCQWESKSVPIMGKQKCTTPREKTCAYEGGTVISSPPC